MIVSRISPLELSVWDKSVESTLNMVYSLILAQLWDKPTSPTPGGSDKWVGVRLSDFYYDKLSFIFVQSQFWRNIIYQRELYIKCQEVRGSVLETPHFVRSESEARENQVLHYLLQHLKLTSEDKTNYYKRLLNR